MIRAHVWKCDVAKCLKSSKLEDLVHFLTKFILEPLNLHGRVEQTKTARACLPTQGEANPGAETRCWTAGWGRLSFKGTIGLSLIRRQVFSFKNLLFFVLFAVKFFISNPTSRQLGKRAP